MTMYCMNSGIGGFLRKLAVMQDYIGQGSSGDLLPILLAQTNRYESLIHSRSIGSPPPLVVATLLWSIVG